MTVTAVLVSHDGERWLPRVLEALARQTRRPDAVCAVDTGSTDSSPRLLHDALDGDPDARVLSLGREEPYAAAVRAALDTLPPSASPEDDWIWLLHDDSAPAPDALAALLAAAQRHPDADLLTPKLREWPSLRRLLEVGVTLSGTAKRETGLERGEYDQGQHDRVRAVLAGNTAGLLVRRAVLEEIGPDPALPVFGTDLDLGWRAARAGRTTLAVPDAVVFHAEAAHRGQRSGVVRPRRAERAGQLMVVLANCAGPAVPFVLVRLVLGTLLRALGLLLVRAPGEALDEAAAALGIALRPWRVLAARRRRRATRRVPAREVRHLLPSPWLPYRRGLDAVGDLVSELWHLAREGLARRSRERTWAWGIVLGLALIAASAVAGRDLLGGALSGSTVSGGALLPAPDGVGVWWEAVVSTPVGAWLLPAAAAATLLLGDPDLLVRLVLVLVVPLATFAALRFFRQLLGPVPAWWGALAYGLTVGASGLVGTGRLGVLVAAVVLPLLARSALGMLPFAAPEQRRRAVWRVTAWLALSTAFAPSTWLLALGAAVVALLLGLRARAPRAVLPVLVPVLATPLLLLPWVVTRLGEAPGLLLLDAGLPVAHLGWEPIEVLTARVADGAPAWWGLGVLIAAVVVLLRADTRVYVAWCWAFAGLALLVAAALTRIEVTVPGTGETLVPAPAYPVLVAQAALICAAALGADGLLRRITGAAFGWRQPLAALVAAAAVASPAAAGLWWLSGAGTDGLDRAAADPVPTYMTQISQAQEGHDVLVLSPAPANGVDLGWSVRRGPGVLLGLESAALATPYDDATARAVTTLLTEGGDDAVGDLVDAGVGYVYAAPPASPRIVATLDATSGLAPSSAPQRRAGAWQLEGAGSGTRPVADHQRLPWLLAGQAVALLAVVVLAAPGRREPAEAGGRR